MKKVKVIGEYTRASFEQLIGRFMSNHNVVDIQFSPTSDEYGKVTYLAMIVYEE